MIYFILAFLFFAFLVCIAICIYLLKKVYALEKHCDKNTEFISRHAAVHAKMAEEQADTADRIVDEIEKKWDTSLQKMLAWTPFAPGSESEGN